MLILDEPVNGLDPDGIRWIRDAPAAASLSEGRTVFISSHLMSEMALTADHLIVIGRGRLLADRPMTEMTAAARAKVRIRSPRAEDLAPLLAGRGVDVARQEAEVLSVAGLASADVAETAFSHGMVLHELTPVQVSFEDAYLALTRDHPQYGAIGTTSPAEEGIMNTAGADPVTGNERLADLEQSTRGPPGDTSRGPGLGVDQAPRPAVTAVDGDRHSAAILGGGAFAAVGIVVRDRPPAGKAVALDPGGGALSGVGLAQLAAVAFGVLVVTTEYRTGNPDILHGRPQPATRDLEQGRPRGCRGYRRQPARARHHLRRRGRGYRCGRASRSPCRRPGWLERCSAPRSRSGRSGYWVSASDGCCGAPPAP